jgi:hypothetical protein
MIASFFQSLDARRVEYLLISGQATVLYGAATFSEDIDLWINPTRENCDRFAEALRACGACHYKLTPPLTVEHLQRGHGFHYGLWQETPDEMFLDIMGTPPRVGGFLETRPLARWMDTGWGRLPVVGLRDLVELKKTQRLEDYAIISRLALLWFAQPECRQEPEDYLWAWENVFTHSELQSFIEQRPAALDHIPSQFPSTVNEVARHMLTGGGAPEAAEEAVSGWLQGRMARLQKADRDYWRPIIAELKRLRSQGLLVPEGQPV